MTAILAVVFEKVPAPVAGISSRDVGDDPALHRLRNTANRGPGKLVVPCSRLKTFGPLSFATTGLSLCKSLLTEITDEQLKVSIFQIRLKTLLFKQSFPDE